MNRYLEVLRKLVDSEVTTPCRPNTEQKMLPGGVKLDFDMAAGFPMVTTKEVRLKSVWAELEWMLSGESNVKPIMVDRYGVRFWMKWARDFKEKRAKEGIDIVDGYVGPMYGVQWRDWDRRSEAPKRMYMNQIDQIKNAQELLDVNPYSRRNMVSAWNPHEIPDMALPPCHFAHQWIFDGSRLNLHMFIRSLDFFIGAPFNIAFYALLLELMAHRSGKIAGILTIHGSHVHLYKIHYDFAREQLGRAPFQLPKLHIACEPKDLWDYRFDDISLEGYLHHPAIKAGVEV